MTDQLTDASAIIPYAPKENSTARKPMWTKRGMQFSDWLTVRLTLR
jgi:hypothetical protein